MDYEHHTRVKRLDLPIDHTYMFGVASMCVGEVRPAVDKGAT